MIKYIPDDFLGFLPMYGEVPFPYISIGIGELWNILIIFGIIYFIFIQRKQNLYYKNGLIKKYATYLLSGKTGKGKTRLMSQIARDCKSNNTIVTSNFFNEYCDVFYSSFGDFCRLQRDIAIFGLHQNFDTKRKSEISFKFPGYFDVEIDVKKTLNKIKGKYDFLTLGDEFYAYLFNRNFMANFAKGEGKQLLIDLHQTRHAKQTMILASQNADSLDHDTRELAHNEIEVKSWFLDLFYGFNIQQYLNKYDQKEFGVEFRKVNKIPYLFFNFYIVGKGIDDFFKNLKSNIDKVNIKGYKINTDWIKTDWGLFKESRLKYETNFNVRTDIDIYKTGDLYEFLVKLEKNKK